MKNISTNTSTVYDLAKDSSIYKLETSSE